MEIYGAAHPSTLNSVSNLADLDNAIGHDAEAEPLHRQALDGRLRALGPDHERTLNSQQALAATLVNLGRHAEAERFASEAATRGAATLGDKHMATLSAQVTRARALEGLGRTAEAETLLRQQLSILADKKAKGEDIGEGDALTHEARVWLAMALASLGRWSEAEVLLLDAVPHLPPHHADTMRATRFVADFYDRWNRAQPDPVRVAHAAEWRQRVASGEGESRVR